MSTTSLGISERGVLAALGGVWMNGGWMPGGRLPATLLCGKGGALAGAGTAGSMPAARNLSSKEVGSGTGEDDAPGARRLKEGWE